MRNLSLSAGVMAATCKTRLPVTEFEYLRMRVAQEDEKARKVLGTEAELVHRSLAAHYARTAAASLSAEAANDTSEPPAKSA